MKDPRIKIAVLEDTKELADALKIIINNDDDMVCHHVYYTAEDAINFIPHHDINILIADIGLPRQSGLQAIATLKQKCPNLIFCIFTIYEDDEKIFEAIRVGAKGYILKGAGQKNIIYAIKELYNGGSPITPSIARRLIDSFNSPRYNNKNSDNTNDYALTDREIDLLTQLSKGLQYKEIADVSGITVGTVKQHIHKIYHKLHVTNKVEALNKYFS